MRVVGGANSSEGRVEVCLNGQWGKVHIYYHSFVVCGVLPHYSSGKIGLLLSYF